MTVLSRSKKAASMPTMLNRRSTWCHSTIAAPLARAHGRSVAAGRLSRR